MIPPVPRDTQRQARLQIFSGALPGARCVSECRRRGAEREIVYVEEACTQPFRVERISESREIAGAVRRTS